MTPDHKCPRCGTLRPSGEVAHTCVVRNPADTGTSREGDPYAEIAALRAELQRKDAALTTIRLAAEAYEACPVDSSDRPESWSRLSALVRAALEKEQSNANR